MGHAAWRLDPVSGGRTKGARARGETDSLWRTLSRRHHLALARWRGRARWAPHGRHSAGDAGWNGQLHVRLSEFHAALGGAVETIGQRVAPLPFDRIYGAFWERVIRTRGPEIVRRSVARYLGAIDSSGSSSGNERTLSG